MRLLLFIVLTTLTLSTRGQPSIEFLDKDGIKIKLIDSNKFVKPIDLSFFKENMSGQLIFPALDTATIIYEFDIEKIKTLKRNKEFVLTITQRSQPKDKRKLSYFGRGFFHLTINKKGGKYILDKLKLLNMEI
jgi:predicted nucleotidyltransferase component of viral defense system